VARYKQAGVSAVRAVEPGTGKGDWPVT